MTRPLRPLATLLLAAFLLTGCSPAGPDQSDLLSILQQEIDPGGEVVTVDSIDQMNAAEKNGVWLVDVTATLLFPQGLTEVARNMQEDSGVAQNIERLGLMLRFGHFEAGETRSHQTRLRLIKGENGWMRADPEGD